MGEGESFCMSAVYSHRYNNLTTAGIVFDMECSGWNVQWTDAS